MGAAAPGRARKPAPGHAARIQAGRGVQCMGGHWPHRRSAPWRYAGGSAYCPLCKAVRRLVVVPWMHGWRRCEYCMLKLPAGRLALKTLGIVP